MNKRREVTEDEKLYEVIIGMGYTLKKQRGEINKAFKLGKPYYITFGRKVHTDDIIWAAKEVFMCAGYNPSSYNFELDLCGRAYLVKVTVTN